MRLWKQTAHPDNNVSKDLIVQNISLHSAIGPWLYVILEKVSLPPLLYPKLANLASPRFFYNFLIAKEFIIERIIN